MTTYTVQFTLPVDNPMNNVLIERRKGHMTFLLPLNYPDAHNMGFKDLLAAAELSGLFTVSTPLNNKVLNYKETISKVKAKSPPAAESGK